ncbi:MAG TPA: hypothetical protein VGJ97_05935 [Anaerolineaceae bacterium]|jgi:Gpi18-like mannosyltransferase
MVKSIPLPARLTTLKDRASAGLRAWYWDAVLLPFITTRLVWVLIAWFASYFPTSTTFDKYVARGGFLSNHYWLDIWCRWDSRWYLSIITDGYRQLAPSVIATHFTNLAFFPLYPYLVKLAAVLAIPFQSQGFYLTFGVILSNLCFLGGAGLLYKLIVDWIADEAVARRTLLLIFAFPTSFIFSCFYPEGLFFLLSVATLLLGYQKKWLWAGIVGALLAVSRPQGILVIVPLFLLYMKSVEWKLRSIRLDLGWQALIPAALAAHFVSLYSRTGTLIAPLVAQQPWRSDKNIIQDAIYLIHLQPSLNVWQIDGIIWVLFAVILIAGAWRLRSWPIAVYGLLQLVLPVSTGTFFSFARFAVTIFPIFIMLAMFLKKRSLLFIVVAVLFTFQVMYWLGWVNYFWIS